MKFLTHTKHIFSKEKRFNPHALWTMFCISFIILVILELCYFSWYFMATTTMLDAPVAANLETNAGKIKSMQKTLDEVEATLHERAGVVFEASQNTPPVVQ